MFFLESKRLIALFLVSVFFGIHCQSKFRNEKPQTKISVSNEIPTKLQTEDLVIGKGEKIQPLQTLTVHYTGWLENGKKFDSSYDRGQPFQFQFGTGRVIQGWDLGMKEMRVGGKRKLKIPASLAYGERGAGSVIPPHSHLIFEVEILQATSAHN